MCRVKNFAAIATAAVLLIVPAATAAAQAGADAVESFRNGSADDRSAPAQSATAQQPAAPGTPPDAALANRPAVAERVTFKEAVERALARNPTIEQAAADILRADALVRQARASALPNVNFNITTTTVHPVIEFDGQSATPRNQLASTPQASALLFAPVLWAQRAQAQDNKVVAERSRDETRRQIGLASAQAYLAIIGQRRLAETALRARDTARAHYDLAFQQEEKGSGSKLNALRAQQELSTDEAALEDALYGVYQAQEALGVLLAAAGPVDATEDPVLETPAEAAPAETLAGERADIRLAIARELAAERVVRDSWKEYLPTVQGLFTPQFITPETLFQQSWGWRAQVLFDVPILDFGLRAARKAEREALLSRTKLEGVDVRRQAASEIRSFTEAVRSAERALTAARAGANQAQQVVEIVNVAFRAGATTNIEVIDAQRRARDADTSAALTEDRLRRARLDLLVAMGRFPQ
jgi:outer membrane protein